MPGIVYPSKCVLCGKLLTKEETDLCSTCRIESPDFIYAKRSVPFVAKWTALWYYRDNVVKSIHSFKFYNDRSFAHSYGRLLADKLKEEAFFEGCDLISWVPISRRRQFSRGYDQSELLAKALARELGMTVRKTLQKIRHNPPQSLSRTASARKANVLGVYRAINRDDICGKRILLVDDILTTGATVSECAKMLLIAGAKEVRVATIASSYHKNTKKYR